jgi:hypothetical protein
MAKYANRLNREVRELLSENRQLRERIRLRAEEDRLAPPTPLQDATLRQRQASADVARMTAESAELDLEISDHKEKTSFDRIWQVKHGLAETQKMLESVKRVCQRLSLDLHLQKDEMD